MSTTGDDPAVEVDRSAAADPAALVQGELFPAPRAPSPDAFARAVGAGVPGPLRVVLTRNRSTMISLRRARDGGFRLRLHEQFLAAPPAVVAALNRYLRTRRRDAWQPVAAFARTIVVAPAPASRAPLRRRGRVHDLAAIAAEIGQRFFGGRAPCAVGWGRPVAPGGRRRTRSIRFGACVRERALAVVNARLDDPRVPRAFVGYIVFHECLHAVVPSERQAGGLAHHPPAFRRLERQFPDLARMRALARQLLGLRDLGRGPL